MAEIFSATGRNDKPGLQGSFALHFGLARSVIPIVVILICRLSLVSCMLIIISGKLGAQP